jgi:hypothetical protein
MNDLEEYLEIKRKAEQAQRDVDRAKAKMEMEMESLDKKCGCTTIEEAKKKLEKMKKTRSEIRKEFLTEKERFEDKWSAKWAD